MNEPHKILYFAHADERLYDLIRAELPSGASLLTLSRESDAERLEKIRDADMVILAGRKLDASFIKAAPRLRLVQFLGVGYHDYVDLDALKHRRIGLTITPAGTSEAVSEHTIMLMIAVCKRLSYVDAQLRKGEWLAQSLRAESRQLMGMHIGIVGLGRIGTEVARRLGVFGARISYCDVVEKPRALERALGVERLDLASLLRQCDLVTLHVPLTKETLHMINGATLALMKPGAILINCARGPVVQEKALAYALTSGHLSGAGLDVYEHEPPGSVSPLASFHNVVLTPHIAAGTRDIFQMKIREMVADASRYFQGGDVVNLMTPNFVADM